MSEKRMVIFPISFGYAMPEQKDTKSYYKLARQLDITILKVAWTHHGFSNPVMVKGETLAFVQHSKSISLACKNYCCHFKRLPRALPRILIHIPCIHLYSVMFYNHTQNVTQKNTSSPFASSSSHGFFLMLYQSSACSVTSDLLFRDLNIHPDSCLAAF